jgi:hypothetical protein
MLAFLPGETSAQNTYDYFNTDECVYTCRLSLYCCDGELAETSARARARRVPNAVLEHGAWPWNVASIFLEMDVAVGGDLLQVHREVWGGKKPYFELGEVQGALGELQGQTEGGDAPPPVTLSPPIAPYVAAGTTGAAMPALRYVESMTRRRLDDIDDDDQHVSEPTNHYPAPATPNSLARSEPHAA